MEQLVLPLQVLQVHDKITIFFKRCRSSTFFFKKNYKITFIVNVNTVKICKIFNRYHLFTILCIFSSLNLVHASNYGTTGLIDTPTARMHSDGSFRFSIHTNSLLESYAMTYQAFDWLEGTFRYTGINDIYPNSNYVYWDRNYELKARILKETKYLPEVALGIRDLIGTGLYGAEYIVASKKWQQWDFSMGLGWGRLSDRSSISNPMTLFSNQFESRDNFANFVGSGGELSSGTFFRGKNIGIFGGVDYRFDNLPISFHAEFNPDKNEWEGSFGRDPKTKSPLSYGLTLHLNDNIDLSISHQHMDHIGLRLQVLLNTQEQPYQFKPKNYVSSLDMDSSQFPTGINSKLWYDRLLLDIERSELFLLSAKLIPSKSKAILEINNDNYAYWPDALAHAHRLTSLHLPKYITSIDYIINEQGHNLHSVTLPRQKPGELFTWKNDILINPGKVISLPDHVTNFVKDKMLFEATIDTRFMLFDPDQPLTYQIYANLSTKYDLPDNWVFRASYRYDLHNNIDELSRVSNSILPKVRSDSLKYLEQGQNGFEAMFIEKRSTFSNQPELHYRVFGGVLEDMFSGVGGEVLFQPYASRLAFGMSGAYAIQRDYDASFGHLDYKVLTGHLSMFWATPFKNYDIAVHAGRYLAKDVGATLEVRRTFDNGWQLGLWATKTNVSSEEFGEGSFDKGIFLRIPLDNILQNGRKSVSKTRIRPIQRDGGARLEGFSGDMWWDIRDARFDLFANPIRR